MRTVTERIAPSSMPRQRADRDPSDSVPAPAADDAAQEPLDFGARVPESYDELYRLAERVIFRRRPGTSIRATSLVHETYLRLTRSGGTPVRDDRHLLALAARAMRQVLVDRARRRGSLKAGGAVRGVSIDEHQIPFEAPRGDLLAVDEALRKLAGIAPRKARVVELRFFGGLSVEEAACTLDIAPMTVKRDWAFAKAWILREIESA